MHAMPDKDRSAGCPTRRTLSPYGSAPTAPPHWRLLHYPNAVPRGAGLDQLMTNGSVPCGASSSGPSMQLLQVPAQEATIAFGVKSWPALTLCISFSRLSRSVSLHSSS